LQCRPALGLELREFAFRVCCVSLANFVQVHDLELSSHGSQLM
jgi:hypothetical protein